jgi:hypothetical protein
MTLGEHVLLYCERGTSEALLAEPVNAASNAAFLLAALAGLGLLLLRPREERSADHYLLVGLVVLIGLGSLAFHLFATTATELADVLPIGIFMLVYLGFALNRFLGVPAGWTVLLVVGFMALMAANLQVKCWDGGIGVPGPEVQGAKPCLNGSLFYLPALGALIVVGLLLEEKCHKAARYLLWAAAVFAASVALRTLDMALCDRILFQGRAVGTHFAWHVLNGLALFLLLRASLEGRPDALRESAAVPEQAEGGGPSAAQTVAAPVPVVAAEPGVVQEAQAPKACSSVPMTLAERMATAATVEEAAPDAEEAGKEKEPDKTLLPA